MERLDNILPNNCYTFQYLFLMLSVPESVFVSEELQTHFNGATRMCWGSDWIPHKNIDRLEDTFSMQNLRSRAFLLIFGIKLFVWGSQETHKWARQHLRISELRNTTKKVWHCWGEGEGEKVLQQLISLNWGIFLREERIHGNDISKRAPNPIPKGSQTIY